MGSPLSRCGGCGRLIDAGCALCRECSDRAELQVPSEPVDWAPEQNLLRSAGIGVLVSAVCLGVVGVLTGGAALRLLAVGITPVAWEHTSRGIPNHLFALVLPVLLWALLAPQARGIGDGGPTDLFDEEEVSAGTWAAALAGFLAASVSLLIYAGGIAPGEASVLASRGGHLAPGLRWSFGLPVLVECVAIAAAVISARRFPA